MPSMPKPKSRSLTIFLLKPGYTTPTLALKSVSSLSKHSIQSNNTTVGELYVRVQPARPPKWASFFASSASPTLPGMLNAGTAAALLVKAGGRTFAVTFGYGRHLLAPGAWEERFGLLTTLNSLPPDQLRSIDVQSFDTISSHTRTQASQAGEARDFGFDIEQDLLRAVTGSPTDKSLGSRLTGMDALHTTLPLRLTDLKAQLVLYLRKSQDSAYKTAFPWIDQIAEIRDPLEIARLTKEVIARLQAHTLDRMWLALPQLVDWKDIAGFRFEGEEEGETHDDIFLNDFIATFDDVSDISADSLKARRIFSIAADSDVVIDTWTAYQCLYAEIDEAGTTCLISAGKWYRIAKDFVGEVNTAVKGLVSTSLALPVYEHASEGEYNKAAAAADAHLALMDAKPIQHGGSAGGVEFCDLFRDDKKLIHVKRYGGSSVALSHLFAQGENSGTLLATDPDFRTKVRAKMATSFSNLIPAVRPAQDEFEVVFAVVSHSARPIDASLPFFSRLNLRNRARVLRGQGYKVSLVRIQATT